MRKIRLSGRFLCLAFASLSTFAAVNNCPTANTSLSRTFTGGNPYTVSTPGTGAGSSPISNSLTGVNAELAAGGGTPGCTAIDLAFSNFAVTSSGTNDVGVLPSAGGTYMFVSPSGTTQTNPDILTFATIQGTGAAADGAVNDGTTNYKTQTGQTFTSTMSYGVADSAPSGIEGVLVTVFGIMVQTGGSGSMVVDTCAKGTGSINPTGNITTQAQCNTAVGGTGVFQTTTITLSTAASLAGEILPTGHPSYINITQVITVTGGSAANNETGFLTFSDEFFETPEPSTFLLLGAGLALAGLTRFRAFGADKRT